MPVSVKIEPLEKDIDLIFREDLSPEARSATLARFARETLAEAETTNEAALGHPAAHRTFVDGHEGAQEESVRPDGEIAYEFNLVEDLFAWIGEQLVTHSPRRTGRFAESFRFFADGVEVEPSAPVKATASEFLFLNTQPYARKIERGESPQSPDGVFEVVAVLAQRRFGNVAKVRFEYRAMVNGAVLTGRHGNRSSNRTPAIVITLR